jgi:hypothetical protein
MIKYFILGISFITTNMIIGYCLRLILEHKHPTTKFSMRKVVFEIRVQFNHLMRTITDHRCKSALLAIFVCNLILFGIGVIYNPDKLFSYMFTFSTVAINLIYIYKIKSKEIIAFRKKAVQPK